MKTYENWTQEKRNELEAMEPDGVAVDIEMEQVKQELKRKRTFIIGATSEKKKRHIAKKHLIDEHDVPADDAEDVADDVVTDLVIELESEEILENHRPQLDGETKVVLWNRMQPRLSVDLG